MKYIEETKIKLTSECKEIQQYLEITCSDDPAEIQQRGTELSVFLARTGKMLADAKQIYNVERAEELANIISDIEKSKFSAKVQNALVDSLCNDTKYLVDWIDRLNASCTHQLDFLRTLISKAKAEMQYLNMQK